MKNKDSNIAIHLNFSGSYQKPGFYIHGPFSIEKQDQAEI